MRPGMKNRVLHMKTDAEGRYRAALYLRLSREDETHGQSESIANQQALLQRYAEEQNFLIVESYIDDGYSGLHFDRPGFQRLLRDIEAGRVNLVLTKDLSRLGRDYIDTGYYLERYFPSRQVRYIALADGIDTFDRHSAQNDMGPFKSVMNDMYAKDISKKVRAVMDAKRESGKFIGAFAPYGYCKDPADKNHLLPDKPAAGVVSGIFSAYLAGASMAEIARQLDEADVPPPSRYKAEIQRLPYAGTNAAQLWRAETIRTILGNPTYAGDVAQRKNEKLSYKLKASRKLPREAWTIVENTHEAIIDRAAFLTVQQMLQSRGGGRARRGAQLHLLSGLVFCGECGRPMTFCRRSSGESFVLVCSGYSRYGECQRNTTDEAALEQLALARLRGLARRALPPGAEQALLRECGQGRAALRAREKAHAQERRSQTEWVLKLLYEDRAARRIGEDEFEKLARAYREERQALQRRLGEKLPMDGDESLPLQNAAHGLLSFEQPDHRMLCQLVRRIAVGQGGAVTIEYRFPQPGPASGA